MIRDAVLASSEAQRLELWRMREMMAEAQKAEGVAIKHDVSVPVSRVADLIRLASERLEARFPGIRIVAFGHVGDGNIHYNCGRGDAEGARALMGQAAEVNHVVYETVRELGGSISAEHGLGVLKREEITRYKGEVEMSLMRAVKRAFDPDNLMNPGKVL
jgi:FAD/FMN-containing dehydrogenase